MKKSKIISRLISNKPWKENEFWDSLPDVVYSKDIPTRAVWRNDPNHPKIILFKQDDYNHGE
jgi:hypothetical protein